MTIEKRSSRVETTQTTLTTATRRAGYVTGLMLACAACAADRLNVDAGRGTVSPQPTTADGAVGLALDVSDGVGTPLRVRAGQSFYLDQLDVRVATAASEDDGVQSLARTGALAALDWRGVTLADEEYLPAPNPDGTFVRRRFYRGAAWMDRASTLQVDQLDAGGEVVAEPWLVSLGAAAGQEPTDGFFVRRLRAIQHARDCGGARDCTGAKDFLEEALVELRHAINERPVRRIDARAERLRVRWISTSVLTYEIPLTQVPEPAYGYGFRIGIEALSQPNADGAFDPGARLDFRVSFQDGSGRRLHPDGSLPTYEESLAPDAAGLRYYDPREPVATYWRRKHREHQVLASLLGPTGDLRPIHSPVGFAELMTREALVTGVPERDGVVAQLWSFPPFAALLAGELDAPVSDIFSFRLPEDAPAGTYHVTVKARRNYLGQELPLSETIDIQVGSAQETTAPLGVGRCENCHTGPSSLERVLHGNASLATCTTCHMPLAFEPEGPIAVRLHYIHSRSGRFGADLAACATCHLDASSIQRTSASACLSCHESYPSDHVAQFGPIVSSYVGGPLATAFAPCGDGCHASHPRSGL